VAKNRVLGRILVGAILGPETSKNKNSSNSIFYFYRIGADRRPPSHHVSTLREVHTRTFYVKIRVHCGSTSSTPGKLRRPSSPRAPVFDPSVPSVYSLGMVLAGQRGRTGRSAPIIVCTSLMARYEAVAATSSRAIELVHWFDLALSSSERGRRRANE